MQKNVNQVFLTRNIKQNIITDIYRNVAKGGFNSSTELQMQASGGKDLETLNIWLLQNSTDCYNISFKTYSTAMREENFNKTLNYNNG